MVREAPPIGRILPELESLWDRRVLVGHNVGFDVTVLNRARAAHGLPPLPNLALDTRRLAAALHPDWLQDDLETLAGRLGVPVVGRHTAEGDARAAGDLLLALLPELAGRGFRTVAELVWFQDTVVWSRLIY
jgi:DNA polymerase III epsilon subunit-like protein